jgi:predicted component of type VI protein secretion system
VEDRATEVTTRLVISLGDALIQVLTISKATLALGRRPYNDVCLDDLTVSGEHAVIRTSDDAVTVLDLNSRNGTLVNGIPVEKQMLVDGDIIDIGAFRLKYVVERANAETEVSAIAPDDLLALSGALAQAKVVQVNGRWRGKETRLEQPIVSLGKAGSHVAAIARRKGGYYLTHIEGLAVPLINGESIGIGSHLLKNGDAIELGGTMYRFHLVE